MTMAVTYNLKNKYILVVVQGSVNKADIESNRSGVIELVKKYHCHSVIADLRLASSALSIGDVFWQPDATAKRLEEEGLMYQSFKRALIVATGDSHADFSEFVARNRGHQVSLFDNIRDAELWLGEPPTRVSSGSSTLAVVP